MVARTGWTRTQQQKCLSYITEEAKAQETQRRRTEPKVCYAIDGETALLDEGHETWVVMDTSERDEMQEDVQMGSGNTGKTER